MNYGLGLSEKKKARERRTRVVKFLFYILLLGAAGAYGYFEGQSEGDHRYETSQDQRDILAKDVTQLKEKTRAAMDKQSAALTEARAWRDKFENEIPKGEVLEILDLVRTRMDDGLDAIRLKNLISLAQNTKNCDLKPETKRFIINTPIFTQIENSISLAGGTVTVKGDGASSVNSEEKPEAWYDPEKPVTIKFTKLGGANEIITGNLPIHKSIVFGLDEFRFSILKGKQSFASISVTRCDFP
ncbi:MAG: hypothetical protein V7727_03780 [Sneathiella sp.]